MSDRTKKILLIVGFILAIILLGLGIYYLLFRPLIVPAPTPPVVTPVPIINALPAVPIAPIINVPPTITLPTEIPQLPTIPTAPLIPGPIISDVGTGGITAYNSLVTDSTLDPTLASNGRDLLYYDKTTGFFYNISPDGQKTLYSDIAFKNVNNVIWSNNTQKAVLEYEDGSKSLYDFSAKKSVTLPSHWKDFSFSDNDGQIAFKDMRVDPENRYISIADTNGGNFRQIEPLGTKDADVYITWSPNNQYIALYRESIDGSRAEVYPIGFNGENYKNFRVEGRDLRFEWSPSGNKIVYSVFNSRSNYNPSLWVANSDPDLLGTGRTSLNVQTWADKCTFANEAEIYCAVPKTLETGTGFRPDLASNTPDEIYKINIQTGAQELVAQPLFPSTVNKLIISEDHKYLYWWEGTSNQIKQI
ncbi:hypothetical protein JW977_01640, partial [Candidatus Falkowbacteria bacterium]|nr:hypothetical protein [Candidatus Falkowbacteria bacterium]